jgi:two-component system, NarL family, sensor histidine kinase YdfH
MREKIMKHIRRIRPLSWLVLVWIIFVCISEQFVLADLRLRAVFTVLILIHIIIYGMGVSVEMRKSWHWLFLLVQAGLVLVLAQVTQQGSVALGLSLTLIVAAVDMFKQLRASLLALGGYVALFLLYLSTLGSDIHWSLIGNVPSGIYVLWFMVFLASVSVVLYLQQERAHERTQVLLRELEATHVQLKEAHASLSAYALRVEELTMFTERQRIARELHDTLSQGLTGLVMQLDAARSYFVKDQHAQGQEIVMQAMTRARTVLTETRYVLHDLRTDKARPDDLPEMVQEEIDRFIRATGIPCDAELDALVNTPVAHCTHVLRVVTEGLTNIARHARAHQVWIRVIPGEQRLEIEVADDGVGFDPKTVAPSSGHYGLIGLHERARLIGGQLTIISSPGKGTTLRVRVPGSEGGSSR